uniref:TACI cysteine-rich domain-containing protein n=1 Tax=Scleropages formosus TaxID=113540 RepID=A0A8C9WGF2_SCLFO
MGGGCGEGQYRDTLLRECVPCQETCSQQHQPTSCIQFCAMMDCKARPAHFYDRLLKLCIRCSDVCGSHPLECSHVCPAQPTGPAAEPAAGRSPANWGHAHPAGGFHTVLIYSLLGLCLAMLLCALLLAVLVLRQRAQGWRKAADRCGGDPDGRGDRGSSQGLSARTLVSEEAPQPLETCIHCFPELRVPGRGGDKQPHRSPPSSPTVYQQAAVDGPFRPSVGKDGALRIICSPSQCST